MHADGPGCNDFNLEGPEKSMRDKWERNEEYLGNGWKSRWNSVDGKLIRQYVGIRMESL